MKPAQPIRLLTAVPICDGHDSAISTINLELIRHGFEVVYLGYHRSVGDIVRAAIQEDVRAVGISSYNGGHVEFFGEVVKQLRNRGAGDIDVFGGGGATIGPADARAMQRRGVDHVFFAGTRLDDIITFLRETYEHRLKTSKQIGNPDRVLGRILSRIEAGHEPRVGRRDRGPLVIGVTGPGGAGKTTLIDELVRRWLVANTSAHIGILSHDPSIIERGALLGDRATMVYSQDDRVFMRSFATRGHAGGLAPHTRQCIAAMSGFDVVFVETVGIGQDSAPFLDTSADRTLFVMSPDYGSRLQLQKIVMLDLADVVVVNKSDLAGAKTAAAELEHRLAGNARRQRLISTTASRNADAGVDALFQFLHAERTAE